MRTRQTRTVPITSPPNRAAIQSDNRAIGIFVSRRAPRRFMRGGARRRNMPIPKTLPPGFVAYSRTREFTPETLPDGLKAAHSTKAGTWALLHVLEGQVLYRLEAPGSGEQLAGTGDKVVIEATVPH